MQVIFIHHSCFLVEVEDKVLIFDYFAGDRVNGYTFKGKLPTYAPDTKIYMFASHTHQDHFDMDILRWTKQYENIKYILSKDIHISPNFLKKHGIDPKVRERVIFVSAEHEYEVDDLEIMTLRSTDAGVAYYVKTDGVSIFHAGDLNDWKWEGVGDLINGRQTRELKSFRTSQSILRLSPWTQDKKMICFLESTMCLRIRMQNIFFLCICGRIIPESGNIKSVFQIQGWQTAS